MSLAVPVISPEELSGLFGNWDVSKLSGFVNGDTVETIIDSVNGNHLIQPTAGNRFTYNTNQFNGGYPSLLKNINPSLQRYYGNSNAIENVWAGDLTLFICAKLPSIITPNIILASGIFNFAGGTGGFEILVYNNQIFYRELNIITTFGSLGITYPLSGFILCVNIKRSGMSFFTINNSRIIMSSNTPSYNQSTYDNIYLFSSPINSAGVLLPSYFNQMVLYNRSLTQQEEGRIIRHLKFKWGV